MGSIGYFLCKLKRSIAQFPRVKLYTDRSLRHLLILSIDRLFPEIVQRIVRSIGYLLCKFKRSIGNSHRYNKSVNTTIDRLFLCKLKRSIAQFPRVKLYTDRSLRHLLVLSIDRLFPEIVQRIIRSIGYLLCKFKRSIVNSHQYNKSVNITIDRLLPLQIEVIDR
jgi:adenine/guanine phosphoribosyltransferase-like PRPP-binding protein